MAGQDSAAPIRGSTWGLPKVKTTSKASGIENKHPFYCFLFFGVFWLEVFWLHSWLCVQDHSWEGLRGPYVVPGIQSRTATCKRSVLPTVQLLSPDEFKNGGGTPRGSGKVAWWVWSGWTILEMLSLVTCSCWFRALTRWCWDMRSGEVVLGTKFMVLHILDICSLLNPAPRIHSRGNVSSHKT